MVSADVQAVSAERVIAGLEVELILLADSKRGGQGCCGNRQGAEDGGFGEQHVGGDGDGEKEAWGENSRELYGGRIA